SAGSTLRNPSNRCEQSRVVLSWSVPYTGNSPVTNKLLKNTLFSGPWSSDAKKVEIPGSNTSVSISSLAPMTTYHFKLQAENVIGRSSFGEIITITTDEEDPPPSPTLRIVSSTSSAVVLGWDTLSVESTSVKGYKLFYRAELPEWDEIEVPDPHSLSTPFDRSAVVLDISFTSSRTMMWAGAIPATL
ncbi:down syndrome cell adhesion molecule, partial [Caerostris extrusa]